MRFLLAILFAVQALANPTFNALLSTTATFVPSDYNSNVGLWIAGRKETGYANSDPVGTANDESGNNRDFTSSGSSRPTFVTGAVNGLPAYDFDGTDDWMSAGDVLDLGTNSMTMMLVIKQQMLGTASINGMVQKSLYLDGVGRWSLAVDDTGIGAFVDDGPGVFTGPATQVTNQFVLITWVAERGATQRLYKNGTLADSDTFSDTATSFNTPSYLLMGAFNNNTDGQTPQAGTYLDCQIAELVIWQAALGTSAREGAEDALMLLYGLP